MKDSLHSNMKIGIVHFMAFPETMGGDGPILETVRSIVEDEFFGAIEIGFVQDPSVVKDIASLTETAAVQVGACGQPVQLGNNLDVNSLDSETRDAAVERLKRAIDQAGELGASRFALLSGPYSGPENEQEAVKLLIDSLNQLSDYSEAEAKIPLVLEVFDRSIDKKSLVGPTTLGVEVSEAVRGDHPEFGLMLDLSHLPLQFETSEHALSTAAGHLVHAHIGNCVLDDQESPLYGDKHPRFGIEGGENDVPEIVEFLRVLKNVGYIGPGKQNIVAFEVRPHGDESSDAVVANAKRTLMEAWARL